MKDSASDMQYKQKEDSSNGKYSELCNTYMWLVLISSLGIILQTTRKLFKREGL